MQLFSWTFVIELIISLSHYWLDTFRKPVVEVLFYIHRQPIERERLESDGESWDVLGVDP